MMLIGLVMASQLGHIPTISPSQSTSSRNPMVRGQSNSGGGSLVTKLCDFANSHPTLALTVAHRLGFGSTSPAVQAYCVLR